MEILGYLASVLIGVSLGLIGSGGSVLTVPVLVYLFGVSPVLATAYSLLIVGTTSAVGSISFFRKKLVNVKTAVIFGIPSIIAVYLTRAYLVPAIPEHLFAIGQFEVTKGLLIMVLFAVLMILASFNMIKKPKFKLEEATQEQVFNYPLIFLEGMIVGVLTGLVGAGGGFLIIPALVLLSKLSMKEAVGTSLVIIAAKSLIGFLGEKDILAMNWNLLGIVTLVAVLGIFIGSLLSTKIDGKKLKAGFGWFVLVMGIYIILKETMM